VGRVCGQNVGTLWAIVHLFQSVIGAVIVDYKLPTVAKMCIHSPLTVEFLTVFLQITKIIYFFFIDYSPK